MLDEDILATGTSASSQVATALFARLTTFLFPLLLALDADLDRRLVQTFVATLEAILRWRNRAHGLLLSELGGYLSPPSHAPAGTKRLSNLLRSPRWSAAIISCFLWQQADARLSALEAAGEDALVVWDDSVLEKPESLALEGLGPVRSSKAHRLTRIKPGFYDPPAKPIFVPGMHWIGVLLLGMSGPPTVAAMRWWTSRGPGASEMRVEQGKLFAQCVSAWERRVLHIWDRGYAGRPWLLAALTAHVRFIIRWNASYPLVDWQGQERKPSEISRARRSWDHRLLWHSHRQEYRRTGVVAMPVKHSVSSRQLWLVVARQGSGQEPWFLLTSEPVCTIADAWRIVFAYRRRWQVETTRRYSKSELAMESPRVWTWERREKLLLMATLVYAFLLTLLAPVFEPVRQWLLRYWCHRTGKRNRETVTPLYRLRSAVSRLWQEHRPYALSAGP